MQKKHCELLDLEKHEIVTFDCGSLPRDLELSAFLTDSDGARRHVADGNPMWLYYDEGEFVGYGTLGKTNWKIPPPNGKLQAVQIIPFIAVSLVRQRQGYGRRILRDLLNEAYARRSESALIALFVEVNNAPGIALYKSEGFTDFGSPRPPDRLTGLVYQRMVAVLPA